MGHFTERDSCRVVLVVLLGMVGVVIWRRRSAGRHGLFRALATGDYLALEHALRGGIGANSVAGGSQASDRYTPLEIALLRGDERMVALLLRYGADPNRCSPSASVWPAPELGLPVIRAVRAAQPGIAQTLLDAGADIRRAGGLGSFIWHCQGGVERAAHEDRGPASEGLLRCATDLLARAGPEPFPVGVLAAFIRRGGLALAGLVVRSKVTLAGLSEVGRAKLLDRLASNDTAGAIRLLQAAQSGNSSAGPEAVTEP